MITSKNLILLLAFIISMGCSSLSKPKANTSVLETFTSRINFEKGKNNTLTFRNEILIRKNLLKNFGKYKSKLFIIYEDSFEGEIEA